MLYRETVQVRITDIKEELQVKIFNIANIKNEHVRKIEFRKLNFLKDTLRDNLQMFKNIAGKPYHQSFEEIMHEVSR